MPATSIRLQYRDDKEMDKFLHAWIEIIANMKAEDIPSDNTLRNHLLRKIDGSQALHVDLTIFKGRDNDDKKKSYGELLEIMRRHIARVRERSQYCGQGQVCHGLHQSW